MNWFTLTLTLLLFSSPLQAGIVMQIGGSEEEQRSAAMATYEPPEFKTKEDALWWAKRIGWVEEIHNKLVARIDRLKAVVKEKENEALQDGRTIIHSQDDINQILHLRAALEVMEEFKARGHKGNWRQALIWDYYQNYPIPEFKSVQDAVNWANKMKWIEPIRRRLGITIAELRIKTRVCESDICNQKKLNEVARLHNVIDRLSAAKNKMEEYRQLNESGGEEALGASTYAGSVPIALIP